MTGPAPLQLLLWINTGWVSFVAFCCLLPMALSYRRRRENARAAEENFALAQARLAEMEHRQGLRGGASATEDAQQDWERLEQLLELVPMRSMGQADADVDAEVNSRNNNSSQLHSFVRDVVVYMGYSDCLDRNKQERGRRFISILRGTTMKVTEQDLIEKGEEENEGDNESAGDATASHEQGGLDIEAGDGTRFSKINTSRETTLAMSDSSSKASKNKVSESSTGGTEDITSEASLENSMNATVNGVYASDASTLSLDEVDDDPPNDAEDRYIALRLPCSSPSTKKERLVPATCAICLVPYAPGCHVSWSSNRECGHAFHRDCVLLWMLKKQRPECPYCRGAFVADSDANGDGADGKGLVKSVEQVIQREA